MTETTTAAPFLVRDLWPARGRTKIASQANMVLFRARVVTVEELTRLTPSEILDVRLAGPGVIAEIERALAVHGLALADEGPVPARVRRLKAAGLTPTAARAFARQRWPEGEIAPGVRLAVTDHA